MRLKIRKLRVRQCTELNLSELAKWLNPIINGWIAYYGKYRRSALYGMCRHVNKALVRWAMSKYKRLRGRKIKAAVMLEQTARQHSYMFAHWRHGMIGVFA